MIRHQPAGKDRSALCHVITDFHSASQRRLARFDLLGVTVSALLAALMLEGVRFALSL